MSLGAAQTVKAVVNSAESVLVELYLSTERTSPILKGKFNSIHNAFIHRLAAALAE